MTDLNITYAEIVAHAKSQDMRIFPSASLIGQNSGLVVWYEGDGDWKSFLENAHAEGAKTIILSKEMGESSRANEIGSLSVAWIKDGVVFMFAETTGWWDEARKAEEDLGPIRPSVSVGYGREISEDVLSNLMSTSVGDLAREMIEFAEEEFPAPVDQLPTYQLTTLFWQKKGVPRYLDDPDLSIKVRKVEMFVQQKLEAESIQREKELLPKLVEKCLEWTTEMGLHKVTKSNVDYFLTENDVRLSKTSRDAIYNKVNFDLKH